MDDFFIIFWLVEFYVGKNDGQLQIIIWGYIWQQVVCQLLAHRNALLFDLVYCLKHTAHQTIIAFSDHLV